MNIRRISTIALASGTVLMTGVLCQNAQAQGIVVQGSATLADSFGTSTGPEALTVDYAVILNAGVYTYAYTVLNPVGDVLLNNSGQPTSTPEIVDAFSVAFDATSPASYIPGTQAGGTGDQDNGTAGLFWSFAAVNPGSSSATLSFESLLPPSTGNANAQDANPPSPWSSNPAGQQVPVPSAVPEPGTMALFSMTALLLLPLRTKISQLIRS